MIDTETYYIKKMDKPISFINKIIGLKVDNDRNILLYGNLKNNSYINKILKKLEKKEIYNIVLEKNLQENEKLICALNANQKKIFDGRWIEKYISIEILDYIINKMMVKKEEKEIVENMEDGIVISGSGMNDGNNSNSGNDSKNENVKININTANVKELQKLSGIGESIALRIVTYRKENGKFNSIEDLKNVSGIGENKFNKIKNNIFVK